MQLFCTQEPVPDSGHTYKTKTISVTSWKILPVLPWCIKLDYPHKMAVQHHLLEIVRRKVVHIIGWTVEGVAAQHEHAQ